MTKYSFLWKFMAYQAQHPHSEAIARGTVMVWQTANG